MSHQPVKNLYFCDKTVHLDGYSFDNCRFDRCTLKCGDGGHWMKNCHLDNLTVVEFSSDGYQGLCIQLEKAESHTTYQAVQRGIILGAAWFAVGTIIALFSLLIFGVL